MFYNHFFFIFELKKTVLPQLMKRYEEALRQAELDKMEAEAVAKKAN